MKDIANVDYRLPKRVFNGFNNKNIGDYHDYHDVFESFRNKCTEIYELDLAHFLSPSALAWQEIN